MQEQDSIKEMAEYFRYGLQIGLHSVADAMDWIDTVLVTQTNPDIAFIEASLCGSRGRFAVADWLNQVPGTFDKRYVVHRLLGAMGASLRQDRTQAQIVVRWLVEMTMAGDLPDEEAEVAMWSFEENLSMAADGIYGSVEEVTKGLERFLSDYAPS